MVVLVQLYFYNLEAEEALKGKTSALFKSAGMRFSIAAPRCSIHPPALADAVPLLFEVQ